jgi:hypothetical protein
MMSAAVTRAVEVGEETVGLAQPHPVERVADRARIGK